MSSTPFHGTQRTVRTKLYESAGGILIWLVVLGSTLHRLTMRRSLIWTLFAGVGFFVGGSFLAALQTIPTGRFRIGSLVSVCVVWRAAPLVGSGGRRSPPRLVLEINNISERLTVGVTHNKTVRRRLGGPGGREAAFWHCKWGSETALLEPFLLDLFWTHDF